MSCSFHQTVPHSVKKHVLISNSIEFNSIFFVVAHLLLCPRLSHRKNFPTVLCVRPSEAAVVYDGMVVMARGRHKSIAARGPIIDTHVRGVANTFGTVARARARRHTKTY